MWLPVIALLALGFVFLARETEATEFVRKEIKRRAAVGRVHDHLDGNHRPARFLDALLSCAPCCAAWASLPAIAIWWVIGQVNEIAGAIIILLVVGPVAAVGLLYAFTLLSPTQAMGAALVGLARFKKIEEKKDGGTGAKEDPNSTGC